MNEKLLNQTDFIVLKCDKFHAFKAVDIDFKSLEIQSFLVR